MAVLPGHDYGGLQDRVLGDEDTMPGGGLREFKPVLGTRHASSSNNFMPST